MTTAQLGPRTASPAAGHASSGRAAWHRRAAIVPLAYLVLVVVVGIAHPFLPTWRWLIIHLLLLGAATNAILVWSAHFTAAILRSPPSTSRWGEAVRLGLLNVGVVVILIGGIAPLPWLGVAGAALVFTAVALHLWRLGSKLRASLPARFAVTVRYYLAGGIALLTGVPVGAWMMVVDDATRPRLILFHAHVNLLGFITLTVLGTVLTFWPTVLRTRMADNAGAATKRALVPAVVGLSLLGLGLLAWWPLIAAAGLVFVAAGVILCAVPAVIAARAKPPASFAAASIGAGLVWLLVALTVDAWSTLTAADPAAAAYGFDLVLAPLLAGFVAQVLIGALSYLIPMSLGGGPAAVRARQSIMDRHWPQRVAMANAALAMFLLPTPSLVRIITSMLVLVGLVQFLYVTLRVFLTSRSDPMPPAATPAPPEAPARPLGGLAAGLAMVLVAALVGVAAGRATDPAMTVAGAEQGVTPTGNTTTVAVTAKDMRFHPDHIEVPAGDRLIIELTNADSRRHDLVLANGARTETVGRGGTVQLDAGIIGATVAGWCSLPGHRAAGMTLTITTTGAADAPPMDHGGADHSGADHGGAGRGGTSTGAAGDLDFMAQPEAGFVAHAATAPVTPAARTHQVTLRVQEVEREVAPGVRQRLWTFNGTAPGPVLRGKVGDTFEVTLINEATMEHGVDFHAGALAPDDPMRAIDPGEQLVYRFTATKAGIWMYHCSAMPMLHHIGNGMFGAVIIDPPNLPPVDREYVLVQSELYLGAQNEPGDLAKMQAEHPDAVVFNGYANQYAYRPLTARVGERVRIWVLDAGPNRAAAFHVVGAQFDTVYKEGNWLLRPTDPGGAQVLDLSAAAGGFVETVFPEAGHYPFVNHAMVDAERGARGIFRVE